MGTRSLQTFLASATRTIAGGAVNSADFRDESARGIELYLDITANVGAFTLDVKLQAKDPVSGTYFDVTGAAFPQQNATGTDRMVVHPGIAASAGVTVAQTLPRVYRIVATPGGAGTSITFSVAGFPIS